MATDDVWILGINMTKFGKHKELDTIDLASEAALAAIKDAGCSMKDIGVLAAGNLMAAAAGIGQQLQKQIGQTGIPVYNVTNACATGATALRVAYLTIKAGEADYGLAVGVEKLAGAGLLAGGMRSDDGNVWTPSGRYGSVAPIDGRIGTDTMPGTFAQIGMEYGQKYGGANFELFAVQVHRTRQRHREQRGRTGAAEPEGGVEDVVGTAERPPSPVGVGGQAESAGVTHHVVIREHPRDRGADRVGGAVGRVDRLDVRIAIPGGLQEVEVERLVVLVRSQVEREALGVDPGLGDHHRVAVRRLEHRSPTPVDLVDAVAVPVGVVERLGRLEDVLDVLDVGVLGVLDHAVGDIDAEAVDATVEPEAEDVVELGPDLFVLPVEIGLRRVEQVEVPLAVVDLLPRRSAEHRPPVRGRLAAVGASARLEDVARPLRRAGSGGERRLEPAVFGRRVVGDEIDDHMDAVLVGIGDERFGIGQRSESRVDVAIVGDVVAAVVERRRVPRADPDRVDAEVAQVVEPGSDALHIARAVSVRVGERTGVDLVHDAAAPPTRRLGPVVGGCVGTRSRTLVRGGVAVHPPYASGFSGATATLLRRRDGVCGERRRAQPIWLSWSAQYGARSSRLSTLPGPDFGRGAVTNSTDRGTL